MFFSSCSRSFSMRFLCASSCPCGTSMERSNSAVERTAPVFGTSPTVSVTPANRCTALDIHRHARCGLQAAVSDRDRDRRAVAAAARDHVLQQADLASRLRNRNARDRTADKAVSEDRLRLPRRPADATVLRSGTASPDAAGAARFRRQPAGCASRHSARSLR